MEMRDGEIDGGDRWRCVTWRRLFAFLESSGHSLKDSGDCEAATVGAAFRPVPRRRMGK